MNDDCNTDKAGNVYYVSKLMSLPEFVMNSSNIISWFIMFFIMLDDVIMVFFVGDLSYKLRVTGMVISLIGDIAFTFLTEYLDFFIFKYNLAPFFRISFMILENTSMRNSMIRLFFTISGAYEAIFVFLLNLAIWSGFAYILFHGEYYLSYFFGTLIYE